MTSPHHQEKIPWHCLTDHVEFEGSTGFKIRPASQIDNRKKAFAHFTRALACLIVEAADDQLSVIPKPNASRDTWRDVGVQDDALFPADLVNAINIPAYLGSIDVKFHQRQYWEHAESDYDARFLLMVLTTPENPFRHLAPLIYLAQHPRVAMRNLLSVYTSGPYDTGPSLRTFIDLTMNYYLLLNLILALDFGASFDGGTSRASLFHSCFQNSRPVVSSSNGNKDPHTSFWYSAPPECQSPALRAEYSLRCFRLLVALYAIMKETTLRDIAVGVDPYKSYGGDISAFDKGTLVDVICRALKSISPAFSDLELPLAGDPPAMLAHAPPESNISDEHKGQQSRFVELPTEIHLYIYSFLPVGPETLLDLATTCKRLRDICTPIIYVEPFALLALATNHTRNLEARSAALVKVLSSNPHLASHIRRLSVRVEGIPSNTLLEYPPLQLCLADMFTHLLEINLYVPSECKDCATKREADDSFEVTCGFRTMEAIAAITRRWPHLSSFSLFTFGLSLSHSDEAPTPTLTPAVLMPHNLEKLRTSWNHVLPMSLAARKALVNASSHTLRHLVLDNEQTAMYDLPAFPSLERLELTTDLPIEAIRLLLQKSFSSVRFLSLDTTHDSADSSGITLDLSGIFNDLEHLAVLTWSRLPLSRIIVPPSVVTVQVEYFYKGYPSISVSSSHHLAALCLDGGDHTVFDVLAGSSEEPSSAFKAVRSLELGMPVEAEDLPRLGEIIAARLPQLEALILKVRAFSMRPRREDYPMDDGFDDIQKAAAVGLFESCRGLNTISFNGVPDVWDPIGRFPGRVWTRDSADGGAHMTGRAALPWKVGDIWGCI